MTSTVNKTLMMLPTPNSISYWWTFGSLLGVILALQLMTGIMLAMHYLNNMDMAFSSVVHITRDVNWGWLLRSSHANGASFFFILLYIHTGRGLYYGSYKLFNTWMVGVSMLLITMATAFLGYVLPWGQMSFWGATVITNLLSTIPYLGTDIVMWLWGGFAVDGVTLTRFFTLHFTLPFALLALVMIHLIFLHSTGSNNPLGLPSNTSFIPFHPYFTVKDITCLMFFMLSFLSLVLLYPNMLGDPENFNPADTLKTPQHIQPEWYYLFAYAILRAIPHKLGGVIALLCSIVILYTLPYINNKNMQSTAFYPLNQILFWSFISTVLILTWIGANPVKPPYILIGKIASLIYFMYFLLDPFIAQVWDNFLK